MRRPFPETHSQQNNNNDTFDYHFFFLCILCRLSLFHENEINAPVTCEQKIDERKRKAIVN